MCPCSLGTWVRAQGDTYQVVADVSQFEPPDIVVTTSNCHVAIQAEKVRHPGGGAAYPLPVPSPIHGAMGVLPHGTPFCRGETENGPCQHWSNWELSPGDGTTSSFCPAAPLLLWGNWEWLLPPMV